MNRFSNEDEQDLLSSYNDVKQDIDEIIRNTQHTLLDDYLYIPFEGIRRGGRAVYSRLNGKIIKLLSSKFIGYDDNDNPIYKTIELIL